MNIDPFMGTDADGDHCAEIIYAFFPDAVITRPGNCGFGAAVKRLWSQVTGPFVLHIEDDWILNKTVDQSILQVFDEPSVAQVSFNTKEKNWHGGARGADHVYRDRARVFGVGLPWKVSRPNFTTSPSILRGPFALQAARLMNVTLDPEKQFRGGLNPELERFARPYRNRIYSTGGDFMVTDIGRARREQAGILKETRIGQSVWLKA